MNTNEPIIPNVGWKMVSPSLLGVVQGGEYADRIIDLDGGRIEWHPNQQLSSVGIPGRAVVLQGRGEYVLHFSKLATDPWCTWLSIIAQDLKFTIGDVEFTISEFNTDGFGNVTYRAEGRRK